MNSNFSQELLDLYRRIRTETKLGVVKWDNPEDPTKMKVLFYKQFKDCEEPRYMLFLDKQTKKGGIYEVAYKKILEFDIGVDSLILFFNRLEDHAFRRNESKSSQ
ncbi:MAG: hypothetical protein QXQ19_00420 [Candidatus Aenigmatarchaeota archaeon]